MFGLISYVGACILISSLVTVFYAFTRPMRQRDELRSWRVLVGVFLFCFFAPYGYIEVLTKVVGKNMETAIEDAYAETGIQGQLLYYKVLSFTSEDARIVAVGREPQDWGGTERPVVAMTLKKANDEWKADSYSVVFSDRLKKDSSTLPPYW